MTVVLWIERSWIEVDLDEWRERRDHHPKGEVLGIECLPTKTLERLGAKFPKAQVLLHRQCLEIVSETMGQSVIPSSSCRLDVTLGMKLLERMVKTYFSNLTISSSIANSRRMHNVVDR